MSKGAGKVQRAILDLIASDDDGAWTTTDICAHVYRGVNRVEKKHRVAVARGLRTMVIPETWMVCRLDRQGSEYLVFNRLSLESTTLKYWRSATWVKSYDDFKRYYSHQVGKAREDFEAYRRYYEADEIGRIDITIADYRKRAGLARALGACSPEWFKAIADDVQRLTERRAELLQGALSVSGGKRLRSGNTYEGFVT